ncbi:MAG: DUF3800 domain-containing protein [Sphingomonas sp.]|uniref:DUF3800 domain-containing protein n=1 Tax=Sphingomonas sp. TaxID=28214 RepID=UPI0022732531|nr:DUF3800 domain-containing protein [Sphingomonas sp.]MCX8474259.1 DUF3800 domain-containing protein [Sphingomonas sp.]
MPHKRYIIFCDESDDKGRFYSNFYGGALIEASKQQKLHTELQAVKDDLNIFEGEMKWERITEPYAEKYISFVNATFDIIARGDMKIRIMFTQNRNQPILDEYQIGNDYFLLYYQFIKHAFGLQHSVPHGFTASATLLLDDVPANAEKFHQFKEYMSSLSTFPKWSRAGFSISYEDITDVDSKKHNVLQALDVILGGIQSRLNEKHTKPIPPAKRRSKRARAKERVYKAIKDRIFTLYPNFNVGVSTAATEGPQMRFEHPYRHWLFVPFNAKVDPERTKKAAAKKK